MSKYKVVDARADDKGVITHVKFQGNSQFTSKDRALPIAERGDIENVHVVHRSDTEPYLRTNPNGVKCDNLDDMAED